MTNKWIANNLTWVSALETVNSTYNQTTGSWVATSVSAPISALWNERFSDLRRLRGLEEDWDGEGAAAIDAKSVITAEGILAKVQNGYFELPPTRVDALASGSVVVIWNGENSGYFEAEITSPNYVAVMYMPKAGEPQHFVIARDVPAMPTYVAAPPAVKPSAAMTEQIYKYGT